MTGAAPVPARSPGAAAGLVTAVLLAAIGVVTGRYEAALVAFPLIVCVVLSRPAPVATTTVDVDQPGPSRLHISARLDVDRSWAAEMIVLRASIAGGPEQFLCLSPATIDAVDTTVSVAHSGPQTVAVLDTIVIGAAASTIGPVRTTRASRALPPQYRPITNPPQPTILRRAPGTHRSPRRGHDGDFLDLHEYAPGDRLRRIDWRATARTRGDRLIVRRATEPAEAEIAIILDARDDLGEHVEHWFDSNPADRGVRSLDLAREAAAAIAAGYGAIGDRTSLLTFGSGLPRVRPGTGHRHLDHLVAALTTLNVRGPARPARTIPDPGTASLVYLLSTFLDDDSARAAHEWLRQRRDVILVDTLPGLSAARISAEFQAARDLTILERTHRLADLTAEGAHVVRWRDPGTRDADLRALARARRRP